MELLDTLRREHEMIEVVTRALVAFAGRVDEDTDRADGERFLRFFRLYAGRFHHAREEEVLFPALVRETEVPADRGPIHALLGDHRQMAAALEELAGAILEPERGGSSQAAVRYATMLLQHIDAETSVLFPESEARFRRASVLELEVREPDDEERRARDDGLELARRYGSSNGIPGLFRGEGCACCPSFGVTCDGVEREWSNDLEWEDMLDRVGD